MEEIFAKIKQIRKEKGMTLKELSQLTGFSISYLSQVEREMSSITMTSLNKILQALDVTLKEIFGYIEEDKVEEVYLQSNYNHMLEGVQKIYTQFKVISGHFDKKKMDAYILTMRENSECERSTHPGEEFYIVMNGKATFEIDGKEYEVNKGETIHFPSIKPHKIMNKESVELEMYSIISPVVF